MPPSMLSRAAIAMPRMSPAPVSRAFSSEFVKIRAGTSRAESDGSMASNRPGARRLLSRIPSTIVLASALAACTASEEVEPSTADEAVLRGEGFREAGLDPDAPPQGRIDAVRLTSPTFNVGVTVTTIEGVAAGETLAAVQRAFVEHGGAQCGICTPGMVLASMTLLQAHPNPSMEQIRAGLAGNLCRCTGYMRIFESVVAAMRHQAGA